MSDMNSEEVMAKATQMIEAIQKIWPTTPVTIVILVLFEVQTRLLKVGAEIPTHEALEGLQSVLDHLKQLNPPS